MQALKRGIQSYLLFILLLTGWLVLHLFFLSADPGVHIGPSRDAWTDEGIYTAQIRNYVNHGQLNIQENPAFFKSPVFSLLLYFPFKLAGTYLETARFSVLMYVIVFLLFFIRKKPDRLFFTIAFVFVFCHILIFTYSHLAMAEILGIMFIISAIYTLKSWPLKDSFMGRLKVIFISLAFFFLAFLTKAMFFYMLFFIPCVFLIVSIKSTLFKSTPPKYYLYFFSISLMAVVLFILIYWSIWIIPRNEWALNVINYEGMNRFPFINDIPGTVKFWILNIHFDSIHVFHSIVFLFTLTFFLLLYFFKRISFRWPGNLWFIWLLFELLKLCMKDHPPRYQISLIAASGFLIAYIVNQMMVNQQKWIKYSAIFLVSLYSGKFIGDIRWLLENRTYSIQSANNYIQKFTNDKDIVMGPWAASLSWNEKAYCIPIWRGYMNDIDIIKTYNPSIIISESDQEDSNSAFLKDNIELNGGKIFNIGGRKVEVYLIKPWDTKEYY